MRKKERAAARCFQTTTRKTISSNNSSTYFFIADTRRARHACAYSQSEQSHDFFFSEDRRSRRQTKMVVNGDRTRESVASKSVLSLLSCVAAWTGRCQYPTLHHSGQVSTAAVVRENLHHCVKPKLCEELLHQKESSTRSRSPSKVDLHQSWKIAKLLITSKNTWEQQVVDQGCISCKESPWAVNEAASKNK